jgi:hypothetical protein
MTINELKKELGLTNTDLAGFFGLSPAAYANSSAKPRYEAALCNFHAAVKSKSQVLAKQKENKTGNPETVD